MNDKEYYKKLNDATDKIIKSNASKKIIIAGPGTGKTYLFEEVIKSIGGEKDDFLALTFINNLEQELKRGIGNLAKVNTFHSYSFYLLKKYNNLAYGLDKNFNFYPAIEKIIISDWKLQNGQIIKFNSLFQKLQEGEETVFFLERTNYYNAVGFDDAIYRLFKSLNSEKQFPEEFKLILLDEYQDFNLLETSLISKIIENNPALIAGDDDQALYCELRGSDPEYIRNLCKDQNFKKFELPFCLRCSKPVIGLFKELVSKAQVHNLLTSRIEKGFDYFPPKKENDSQKYPDVKLIITTVQRSRANYWGKYILSEINKIPSDEIKESIENYYPTVLIIGPRHYLKSIKQEFEQSNIYFDYISEPQDLVLNIEDAYRFINKDKESNLGWRIILELIDPDFKKEIILESIKTGESLISLLDKEFINEHVVSAKSVPELGELKEDEKPKNKNGITIKFTTFEGSKGLSAQHVFILGPHNGELPKYTNQLNDLEICKILVALTRARKQCQFLCTSYFGGSRTKKEISEYLKWGRNNLKIIPINANNINSIIK